MMSSSGSFDVGYASTDRIILVSGIDNFHSKRIKSSKVLKIIIIGTNIILNELMLISPVKETCLFYA